MKCVTFVIVKTLTINLKNCNKSLFFPELMNLHVETDDIDLEEWKPELPINRGQFNPESGNHVDPDANPESGYHVDPDAFVNKQNTEHSSPNSEKTINHCNNFYLKCEIKEEIIEDSGKPRIVRTSL